MKRASKALQSVKEVCVTKQQKPLINSLTGGPRLVGQFLELLEKTCYFLKSSQNSRINMVSIDTLGAV